MRSRVACGIERPGTSFSTTDTVAGFKLKYSASFFKLMGRSGGGFFFTIAPSFARTGECNYSDLNGRHTDSVFTPTIDYCNTNHGKLKTARKDSSRDPPRQGQFMHCAALPHDISAVMQKH